MKKSKYALLVVMFCAFSAVNAQVEELSAKNSLFYYSGYLGKTEKLEFNLQLSQLKVSGSYILEQTGELFIFRGRMATDKSGFGVLVYTDNDDYVASMEAKLISTDNDFAKEINGVWKSADGLRILPISLKKVAELATQSTGSTIHFGD
ncbi:MAG: hypothetical protein AAF693_13740 [Bacteroidota bacterium]